MCERCYKIEGIDEKYDEIYYIDVEGCECECNKKDIVNERCKECGHFVKEKGDVKDFFLDWDKAIREGKETNGK